MIKVGSTMVNKADYKAGRKVTPIYIEDYNKSVAEEKEKSAKKVEALAKKAAKK